MGPLTHLVAIKILGSGTWNITPRPRLDGRQTHLGAFHMDLGTLQCVEQQVRATAATHGGRLYDRNCRKYPSALRIGDHDFCPTFSNRLRVVGSQPNKPGPDSMPKT